MVEAPIELWRSADERGIALTPIRGLTTRIVRATPRRPLTTSCAWPASPRAMPSLKFGARTGIATLPLARRGLIVTCLEAGSAMGAIARAKLADFSSITRAQLGVPFLSDYDLLARADIESCLLTRTSDSAILRPDTRSDIPDGSALRKIEDEAPFPPQSAVGSKRGGRDDVGAVDEARRSAPTDSAAAIAWCRPLIRSSGGSCPRRALVGAHVRPR